MGHVRKQRSRWCRLGPGCVIGVCVELGCRPGRTLTVEPSTIGRKAVVRSHSVIYTNTQIGDDFQTGHHVVIREQNTIGDRVWIWNHSTVDYGCRIGNRVRIHNHVYVAQGTRIEDDVFLAPGVMIANDRYPLSTHWEPVTIRKGAVIGVNATLLPGVVIGENALIGAGSVVTRNVAKGMVAYGNPARVRGTVAKLPREAIHA